MKPVITSAEFWDFDTKPKFIGIFDRPMLSEHDDPEKNRKRGDTMGYYFKDFEGNQHIISASHQITKALTSGQVGVGNCLLIEYKGKTQKSDGQNVNKFDVYELEEGDEGFFQ